MTSRRVLLSLSSAAVGALLIVLLVRLGKIDLRMTLLQLESVSPIAIAKLVLLTGLLVYLSTEKWRSVDAALRQSTDSVPSRITSFTMTSVGSVLGLFLPVQVGMATARALGTHLYGGPLRRGAAGTLLEQGFDLIIVVFLVVPSGITRHYRGGAAMWLVVAACMVVAALLTAGPAIGLIRWIASHGVACRWFHRRIGNALASLSELQSTARLERLARRLVILSTIRFGVIVLMSKQTAQAVGAQIPIWHLAAAIPFALIATLVASTPGGIGVNELTTATVLKLFGTPLQVAAPWTLANRVLVMAACLVVATGAVAIRGVEEFLVARTRASKAEDI